MQRENFILTSNSLIRITLGDLEIGNYYIHVDHSGLEIEYIGKLVRIDLVGEIREYFFQKSARDPVTKYNDINLFFIKLEIRLSEGNFSELSENLKRFYITSERDYNAEHYGFNSTCYDLKVYIDDRNIERLPTITQKKILTLDEFNIITTFGSDAEQNNAIRIRNPVSSHIDIYINRDEYTEDFKNEFFIDQFKYDLLTHQEQRFFFFYKNGKYISMYKLFNMDYINYIDFLESIKRTIYANCIIPYSNAAGSIHDTRINVFSIQSLNHAKRVVDRFNSPSNRVEIKQYKTQKKYYNDLITRRNSLLSNRTLIDNIRSLGLDKFVNLETLPLLILP